MLSASETAVKRQAAQHVLIGYYLQNLLLQAILPNLKCLQENGVMMEKKQARD